jgi:hypothetical protein
LQDRRSTFRGLYLPASFRLQGLVTLLTVSSLRSLAGFLSHQQRSWDSPFGAFSSRKASVTFPPGRTHLPFSPADIPGTEVPSRLDRPRFLGFAPCESPWRRQACLAPQPLDAPLGFVLPGFARGSLDQDFARSPLTRFAGYDDLSPHRPAPQSLDRLPPGSILATAASCRCQDRTTLLGFLHPPDPSIRARYHPGYEFTSCVDRHYCQPLSILRMILTSLCRS